MSPANKSLASALVWLRRDLRADDHAALYHALRGAARVWCAFVFDRPILDTLARADRRIEFVRDSLAGLDAALHALALSHGIEGVGLIVRHGVAADEIPALARQLGVQAVFANHDDDPGSITLDTQVRGRLAAVGVALHTSKDHVVFERDEILSASGTPLDQFTPYRSAWLKKLDPYYLRAYPVAQHAGALAPLPAGLTGGVPTLAEIGFERTNLHALKLPSGALGAVEMLVDFLSRIDSYHETREFPAIKGPSYLGPHLRFGTLSIRHAARQAWQGAQAASHGAEAWLSALIRRDFLHQLLHHHPRVAGGPFRPGCERIKWEHGKAADALFAAWAAGRTGYPLVDGAMLQLAQTGYMHNRLRMLVAGFLVKDLGLDWRRGEAWFAMHLNDHDFAINNGGWQWAASCDADAPPVLRIVDPVRQSEKLDPAGRFIRRYLPQLAALPDDLIHAPWRAGELDLAAAGIELGRDYPLPVVLHEEARARTLQRYASAKLR